MSQHDSFNEASGTEEPYPAASLGQAAAGFVPTTRSLAQKVAIACRVLAEAGHNAGFGLASQVTAKDGEGAFWTQTYGLALEEATAANQMRVDMDLQCLTGTGMVNPANRFHAWIYRARADVRAIAHTHAQHVAALAMTGLPLHVAHMDTVALYGRVAHLPQWPGVPFGDDEGRIISQALGQHKAVLLAHHGLVTVGASIEEACNLAMVFEHAAQLQLLALSSGQALPNLPPALGEAARRFAEVPLYALAHFEYYARRVGNASRGETV
jgi:L-fuculose-phosphate aldolase